MQTYTRYPLPSQATSFKCSRPDTVSSRANHPLTVAVPVQDSRINHELLRVTGRIVRAVEGLATPRCRIMMARALIRPDPPKPLSLHRRQLSAALTSGAYPCFVSSSCNDLRWVLGSESICSSASQPEHDSGTMARLERGSGVRSREGGPWRALLADA